MKYRPIRPADATPCCRCEKKRMQEVGFELTVYRFIGLSISVSYAKLGLYDNIFFKDVLFV